jgi:hypothetical protein
VQLLDAYLMERGNVVSIQVVTQVLQAQLPSAQAMVEEDVASI